MRVEELIEHFADDAVMELPFAPGRMAKQHTGKDAILAVSYTHLTLPTNREV